MKPDVEPEPGRCGDEITDGYRHSAAGELPQPTVGRHQRDVELVIESHDGRMGKGVTDVCRLLLQHGDLDLAGISPILECEPELVTSLTSPNASELRDQSGIRFDYPGSHITRVRVEALTDLATPLLAERHLAEAESLLRRALEVAEDAAFHDELVVVRILRNLGRIEQASGRFAETEATYRRALILLKKIIEDLDSETVTLLHDLAVLCEASGRAEEARSLWSEARALLDPSR